MTPNASDLNPVHSCSAQEAIDRSLAGLENPPDRAAEQLLELTQLLASWAARINLTGHRGESEIACGLVADAVGLVVALERGLGAALSGSVVDLGSGAGFPGLPMSILRPSVDVVLIESRERRHYFQRAARRALGLTNVRPILARIEDRSVADVDLVVAQAVGPATSVVQGARPFLRPGGVVVIPGTDALPSPAGCEDLDVEVLEYRAPILDRPRSLWIGRLPS